MASVETATDRFLVRYEPRFTPEHGRRERTTVICIDERAALLRGLHLEAQGRRQQYTTLDRRNESRASDMLYLRTAGGGVGVGQDLHVTMRVLRQRMLRRNSSDAGYAVNPAVQKAHAGANLDQRKIEIPQVHVLGSVVAKAAALEGIDICTHKGCAAEMGAAPISTGLANNQGKNGQEISEVVRPHWQGRGNFGELFKELREAYAEGTAAGMVAPTEESVPLLNDGDLHRGGALRAVPRVPLTDMSHVSDSLIIDWGVGRTLDAAAATTATQQEGDVLTHYYASIGSMHKIGQVITDHILDVDPAEFQEIFEAAAFVRNAATSLWLPEQHGQAPDLYTLAA